MFVTGDKQCFVMPSNRGPRPSFTLTAADMLEMYTTEVHATGLYVINTN